jgi:hypothetical protein
MAAGPPVLISTHVCARTVAGASDRAAAFVSDDARACRYTTCGTLYLWVALAALGIRSTPRPV